LGKESKARKQFAARYGRETLQLQVFGRDRRISEAELDARILCSLALEEPTWPYQVRARIRTSSAKDGYGVPDDRTFRRHFKELAERGYIKVLKKESYHVGTKRIYTLAEKGLTVVTFLPEVQRNLLSFMNLHDKGDLPAMPAERFLRPVLARNMPTIAEYIVREMNTGMLIFDFEQEDDEGIIRDQRLKALERVALDMVRRARQNTPMPKSISTDDAKKYRDALTNDPEFRRCHRELLLDMKMAMDYMLSDVDDVLGML
jgi:DNA-binding PadR family transcriptional regulator